MCVPVKLIAPERFYLPERAQLCVTLALFPQYLFAMVNDVSNL